MHSLPLSHIAARLSVMHQWIGISHDSLSAGGKTTLQAVSQIAADLRVKDPSLTRWAALQASPSVGCVTGGVMSLQFAAGVASSSEETGSS